MKQVLAIAWIALLLACAPVMARPVQDAKPASAATPAEPAQSSLAGEYELTGVMETGSGLRLRADGGFDWYFSYGALDLGARGTWTRTGDRVELVVAEMGFPPQAPQAKFERMQLRVDGDTLVPSWPWDMDAFAQGAERGRYERTSP